MRGYLGMPNELVSSYWFCVFKLVVGWVCWGGGSDSVSGFLYMLQCAPRRNLLETLRSGGLSAFPARWRQVICS